MKIAPAPAPAPAAPPAPAADAAPATGHRPGDPLGPALVRVVEKAKPGSNVIVGSEELFSWDQAPAKRVTGSLEQALESARALSWGDWRIVAHATAVIRAGEGEFLIRRLFGPHPTAHFITDPALDGREDWFGHIESREFTRLDKDLVAVVGGRVTALFGDSDRVVVKGHPGA